MAGRARRWRTSTSSSTPGGDASDPENAVPFSVKTPAGQHLQAARATSTTSSRPRSFGTEPRFAAKGVKPDLDGDGKVEFGEALPDADFLVAAARDFETSAKELDAAARKWSPTQQDAFTALVVMTPTMSEYFEAWKNSRFIAGDKAQEKALRRRVAPAGHRRHPRRARTSSTTTSSRASRRSTASRPARPGPRCSACTSFAQRLREQEAGGKKFTAQDADTLGGEAQDQAEAIAGQVTQAAGQLGIKLED